MNRENIKKVRDLIASLPAEHFNMNRWGHIRNEDGYFVPAMSEQIIKHDCGTCACIGGWAQALLGSPGRVTESTARSADLLGLDCGEAYALFYPNVVDEEWDNITTEQAVSVLDHLLKTGKVDWSVACEVEEAQ